MNRITRTQYENLEEITCIFSLEKRDKYYLEVYVHKKEKTKYIKHDSLRKSDIIGFVNTVFELEKLDHKNCYVNETGSHNEFNKMMKCNFTIVKKPTNNPRKLTFTKKIKVQSS